MDIRVSSPAPGRWLGVPPRRREIGAILLVGVIGIMFAGIGPLLLGGLHNAGRLSAAQLGQAGTAELLTMGIAAGTTGAMVGTARLCTLTILCGLAIAACDLLTVRLDGWALVAMRALAGAPSGALVWLMTAMIVRAPRPERWSAIYLTVQGLAQFAMLAWLGGGILGRYGVDGGFVALAGLGLLAAAAGTLVPRQLAPLPVASEAPSGRPAARGLVALAAAFCFNAGILALWFYLEPLSRQAGHPTGTADLAFASSLGVQVAGGSAAMLLAGRVAWFPILTLAIAAMIALVAVIATLPAAAAFLLVTTLFGFLWMLASPFLTPLAIQADPSRRAAALGSGAALLGCSSGPLLASLTVAEADLRGAIATSAMLLAAALAIVLGLRATASG